MKKSIILRITTLAMAASLTPTHAKDKLSHVSENIAQLEAYVNAIKADFEENEGLLLTELQNINGNVKSPETPKPYSERTDYNDDEYFKNSQKNTFENIKTAAKKLESQSKEKAADKEKMITEVEIKHKMEEYAKNAQTMQSKEQEKTKANDRLNAQKAEEKLISDRLTALHTEASDDQRKRDAQTKNKQLKADIESIKTKQKEKNEPSSSRSYYGF